MRHILLTLFTMLALAVQANPVTDMLERIDRGASKKFKVELRKNDGKEFFELDQQGSKVVVRGHNWIDVAVGVNWYLKHYCGIHIAWNNPTATLPRVLPRVEKPERHETTMTLRYDFNYCTFSYSMAFWDWPRWQQEIDWMALHGVNLPLAAVGEECVWRNMLLKMGYTEEEVGRFIAGPAFLAWWEMNNLEGWGGPLPLSWYRQQEALQKKILQRMREWGMEPVLPGYSGMVPSNFEGVADGGKWNGYTRPAFLQPTDERFHDIASRYYQELTALYGRANYYSMDPFHEGGNTVGVDLDASGKAIMREMKLVNPKAVWVIQGWQENPREELIENLPEGDLLILDLFSECRPKWGIASIFQNDKGYGKHNWLFCLLENFGGNVGLHGRMDQLLSNWEQTQTNPKAKHLKGIGFTMEGSENNPVMFELMSELPWMQPTPTPSRGEGGLTTSSKENTNGKANQTPLPSGGAGGGSFKETWLRDYCFARYGVHNEYIEEAWLLLANSIYNCPAGNNQQGPHESIFCGRPSQNNYQVSSWSKMSNYYDPDDTRRAALLFMKGVGRLSPLQPTPSPSRGEGSLVTSAKEDVNSKTNQAPLPSGGDGGGLLGGESSPCWNNLEYDLVDIVRQALADQGRVQYQQTMADYKAFRREPFQRDAQRFLQMILDQDRLLGTRREFRLGHWTEQARALGTTPAEKDQYEWNARVQITTWGNRACADDGGLRDYAHKEWQGLLKDFYHMRWAAYFKALTDQMEAKSKPDIDKLGNGRYKGLTTAELFSLALEQDVQLDFYAMEEPWTLQHNPYSPTPEGSAVDIAREICEKYLE